MLFFIGGIFAFGSHTAKAKQRKNTIRFLELAFHPSDFFHCPMGYFVMRSFIKVLYIRLVLSLS